MVETASRAAGTENFGLMMVSQMDVINYGIWGHYVLGAENLEAAIQRCITALPYHSTGDEMALTIHGHEARFSYRFSLSNQREYANIASLGAGVLTSLCKAYCPGLWQPLRIELDIPRPRRTAPFEDVFRCPVVFNARKMSVVFDARRLFAAVARPAQSPLITIEDVIRDRRGTVPRDITASVAEQIRLQLFGSGEVKIDAVARSIGFSIRTLQRELNYAGVDFRAMLNAVRIARAAELLRGTPMPIITISTELGYNTPGNFSRMFRQATGQSPSEYRDANLSRVPGFIGNHSG
nr:AraC family transcriptional regulator [Marinicella sp. W31]MDC2878747.1 AraC family transcriptional regulator ligand-binding domain-containing protein [Marinicella sp. W31]